MCFRFVVFTKFDLDPQVIISSLHHPLRLGEMHNTEILIEAMSRLEVGSCADWMRSRAKGDSSFDSFALSMLSKCNFADIFIFNVLLHNANPKIVFSHIYFCCFGTSSRWN